MVVGTPRRLLRVEGATLFAGSLIAYSTTDQAWWLVPLTLSDHDLRYDRGQRAHFFTTLAPAEVVRTKLTEELERIGLAVSPLSDAAAVAKRGQLAVEMRISTVGALIDGVASSAFRSAPPNSVVVEFDAVPA